MRTLSVLLVGVVATTLLSATPAHAQKAKEHMPAEGTWVRNMDQKADGVLAKGQDTHEAKFSVTNNQITGTWKNREDAKNWKFSGEIIDGKTTLIILKEVGSGTVTVYTGKLVAPGHIVGTYYENNGASGDFEFVLKK